MPNVLDRNEKRSLLLKRFIDNTSFTPIDEGGLWDSYNRILRTLPAKDIPRLRSCLWDALFGDWPVRRLAQTFTGAFSMDSKTAEVIAFTEMGRADLEISQMERQEEMASGKGVPARSHGGAVESIPVPEPIPERTPPGGH